MDWVLRVPPRQLPERWDLRSGLSRRRAGLGMRADGMYPAQRLRPIRRSSRSGKQSKGRARSRRMAARRPTRAIRRRASRTRFALCRRAWKRVTSALTHSPPRTRGLSPRSTSTWVAACTTCRCTSRPRRRRPSEQLIESSSCSLLRDALASRARRGSQVHGARESCPASRGRGEDDTRRHSKATKGDAVREHVQGVWTSGDGGLRVESGAMLCQAIEALSDSRRLAAKSTTSARCQKRTLSSASRRRCDRFGWARIADCLTPRTQAGHARALDPACAGACAQKPAAFPRCAQGRRPGQADDASSGQTRALSTTCAQTGCPQRESVSCHLQELTDTNEDQLSLAAIHYLRSHFQEVKPERLSRIS